LGDQVVECLVIAEPVNREQQPTEILALGVYEKLEELTILGKLKDFF
jgi:hypothetical protein